MQVGNKHIYARLQSLLPHEYAAQESHRFRDPYDLQFGYMLAAFTLGARYVLYASHNNTPHPASEWEAT